MRQTKPHDTKGSSERKGQTVTSDLAKRIALAQGGSKAGSSGAASGERAHGSNHGRAVRLGSEFIAAILVGSVMGYLLDLWLGTAPWLMLVMLLIGFAAGVLNVTRSVEELNAANPAPLDADLGPGQEDDEDDYKT